VIIGDSFWMTVTRPWPRIWTIGVIAGTRFSIVGVSAPKTVPMVVASVPRTGPSWPMSGPSEANAGCIAVMPLATPSTKAVMPAVASGVIALANSLVSVPMIVPTTGSTADSSLVTLSSALEKLSPAVDEKLVNIPWAAVNSVVSFACSRSSPPPSAQFCMSLDRLVNVRAPESWADLKTTPKMAPSWTTVWMIPFSAPTDWMAKACTPPALVTMLCSQVPNWAVSCPTSWARGTSIAEPTEPIVPSVAVIGPMYCCSFVMEFERLSNQVPRGRLWMSANSVPMNVPMVPASPPKPPTMPPRNPANAVLTVPMPATGALQKSVWIDALNAVSMAKTSGIVCLRSPKAIDRTVMPMATPGSASRTGRA
jgi:hypothetical protein